MPKDWLRYKAEVHRLYIVEEKTVYQVRDILRERHGFCASVRAYRMHFDEWGMKKYKSTKARSNTASSRHLLSPPTSTIPNILPPSVPTSHSTPSTSDVNMGAQQSESEPLSEGTDSAPRPLNILGRIIFETSDSLHILETLFTQYQSNPNFYTTLTSYFRDPQFNKWVARYSGPEVPVIFELISTRTLEKDRFALTKTLLEADLSTRSYRNLFPNVWQDSWYQACDALEWDEARDMLLEEGVVTQTPGPFHDCALVVLAERLLEKYMGELEDWKGRLLDEEDLRVKEECTKKYQGILGYFHHAKENVDPRFYRFLLRFDLDDGHDWTFSQRPYEDEYRQKYIQLSTRRASAPRVGEPCHTPQSLDASRGFHTITTHSLPPTPPTPSKVQLFDQFPHISPITAVETLRTKWHSLDDFEDYLNTILPHDGSHIFIFTPPHPSSENIFNAITRLIPSADERLSLTKAILTVSSASISSDPPVSSHLLAWWRTLYNPSQPLTYEQFQNQVLHNPSLTTALEHTVSTPEGKRLFLDAAISLTGERLLGSLKNGLRKRESSLSTRGMERQTRYWNVVEVMRDRGLSVDKSWTTYVINSM